MRVDGWLDRPCCCGQGLDGAPSRCCFAAGIARRSTCSPLHPLPAVVEDVGKRREPLPQLVGCYFITPTDASVRSLVRDFSLASMPQYKAAHVFFSSKPSTQQLAAIRECPALVQRLRSLKEVRGGGQRRRRLALAGGGSRWRSAGLTSPVHPCAQPTLGECLHLTTTLAPHSHPPTGQPGVPAGRLAHLCHRRGGGAVRLLRRIRRLVHRLPRRDRGGLACCWRRLWLQVFWGQRAWMLLSAAALTPLLPA